MLKRIKRAYYQWVIRNCQRDINELQRHVRLNGGKMSAYEHHVVESDINDARRDMYRAHKRLSRLW